MLFRSIHFSILLFPSHDRLVDCINVNYEIERNELKDVLCVGLMTSKMSEKQKYRIMDMFTEVVTFLDNDASGKLGTKRVDRDIGQFVELYEMDYLDAFKDPDEVCMAGKFLDYYDNAVESVFQKKLIKAFK